MTDKHKWLRVVTNKPGASLNATLPEGIRRVEVWGMVDVDHHFFNVEIDPPAFGARSYRPNAFNLYTIPDMVIYETVLDPHVRYSIKITALEDGYLDVSQFKFYPGKGDDQGSGGLGAGPIAVIVVGCVAAMGVAYLLLWLFIRRRKSKKHGSNGRIDMESDDGGEVVQHTIEPYTDGPGAGSDTSMHQTASGAHAALPSASHRSSASTSEPLLSPTSLSSSVAGFTVQNPDGQGPSKSTPGAAGGSATSKVRSPPVTVRRIDHTDGGAFVPQHAPASEEVVEEFPPSYQPHWAAASPSASSAPQALPTSEASDTPRGDKQSGQAMS